MFPKLHFLLSSPLHGERYHPHPDKGQPTHQCKTARELPAAILAKAVRQLHQQGYKAAPSFTRMSR